MSCVNYIIEKKSCNRFPRFALSSIKKRERLIRLLQERCLLLEIQTSLHSIHTHRHLKYQAPKYFVNIYHISTVFHL